ncbi:MAG: universal stress protein, partial [Candidatus Nitrosotalea sp.]|nr:universal stress protein [Candidatus Nitrosotalea sp.]
MMKKYSNILVPFDGSEYSKRAMDEAIEISKKLGSKLHIMTAVTVSAVRPPGIILSGMARGKGNTKTAENFVKKAVDEANRMMLENVEYCKRKGVDAIYKVTTKSPTMAILDYEKKTDSDLIMMCSQGLRCIEKIKILGSVSIHVLE